MEQTPAPGQHLLAFRGDTVEFTLRLSQPAQGQARLRANIGHAETARRQIIAEALQHRMRLAEDWYDIPMAPVNERTWRLVLPLLEVGHFEAKAFFLPAGDNVPQWPAGPNTILNVHPAEYCCANIIYNAFVRQFGRLRRPAGAVAPVPAKTLQALDQNGYAVIPPSGTFRDLIRELDFIVHRLGCRILMLLPIHPTPTVYGRMGTYGSPYAALDFMDVDPALAEFDIKATPLEQFQELVDAVHARNARLFLDIAINHTGWAAKIHSEHPDWLVRKPDGAICSPGAWGVVWADLTELNHQRHELWEYLAEVFLIWCRRGVDGFRCDAGYMIPVSAWEFIVAKVRREYPDTVFLLEGLGGKLEATTALLNTANLNMAYSELFQNYDRAQIEAYLPFAARMSSENGLLVHFAETHDNNRLAARSTAYARLRTALSALCSSNGAFAFANGVEWLATEKIDVHCCSDLNWDSAENQVELIARLNAILRAHPAFFPGAQLRLVHQSKQNSIALLRGQPGEQKPLLILANLDDRQMSSVSWNIPDTGLPAVSLIDLLTGKPMAVKITGQQATAELAPAEVLCLSADPQDLSLVNVQGDFPNRPPERVTDQCLRAKALEIWKCYHPAGNQIPPADRLAVDLAADPRAFCRKMNPDSPEDRIIGWDWPRDLNREVMVPPQFGLYITAPQLFRARIRDDRQVLFQENALPQADGRWFVLVPPAAAPDAAQSRALELTVFNADRTEHAAGHLLYLPSGEALDVPMTFYRSDLPDTHPLILGTNGRGGMLRAGVIWGELRSKYDALLAGNLNPDYPVDRQIMLTRCRAWLVYQGYSQDVTHDRLVGCAYGDNIGQWRFQVPFGHGQSVIFDIQTEMVPGKNAVRLTFHRARAPATGDYLGDQYPVTLIIRPDIEDRNFHSVTKAFLGAEKSWPPAVRPIDKGFAFAPDPHRRLQITASQGTFQVEPEWHYLVAHPLEAERGMDAASDLFSPGYFKLTLAGGDLAVLLAQIITPPEPAELAASPAATVLDFPIRSLSLPDVLLQAMRQFIVKRGAAKTVIAGYPWFLDWGRDTFICARGLIAAGLREEVRTILKQFAAFEQNGTLPNMICGADASNRDTSDAPLWFIIACADWRAATHSDHFLQEPIGRRTLRQVLESIAQGYRKGTSNGIRMDPASGLIFSPAHFTWMDTNHPSGTPREGYPVEIQALWFAALKFLATVSQDAVWSKLAEQVQQSIRNYFWDPRRGYLSDCLHAPAGQPAAAAAPDDALRSNQLLAITLGVIEDPTVTTRILAACQELLVPGAIRTLANRPVTYPLPVTRDGKVINDPVNPYWGRYEGDEDGRRKPAYHNGTAWTWLFPSFCEAWVKVYGPAGRAAAQAWLGSAQQIINRGCLGQLPEILDGDYPHRLRGCDAQAWGVTEFYRVLNQVSER